MIVDTASAFIEAYGDGGNLVRQEPAVMRAALLVTPRGFRVSEEAATDNRYMVPGTAVDLERAHTQHAALARTLTDLGVPVLLLPGQEGLDDAVFPNNVYATTPDRCIIGAMRHEVRQQEARREDARALFRDVLKREVRDLSGLGVVAELTGPLVIDRAHAIGLCGRTGRCDDAGARAMHAAFGLALTFLFDLVPEEYHTNLVLAVLGGRACVLHPPSFRDPAVPDAIAHAYPEGSVVRLSDEEKAAFCGNCIAVTDNVVLMSSTAERALSASSRETLARAGFEVASVDITELEKGGGSLRCLIAEIF